jgi:hypothetical protein
MSELNKSCALYRNQKKRKSEKRTNKSSFITETRHSKTNKINPESNYCVATTEKTYNANILVWIGGITVVTPRISNAKNRYQPLHSRIKLTSTQTA